jgi:Bacterial capsule synthesis protein PGA_cap
MSKQKILLISLNSFSLVLLIISLVMANHLISSKKTTVLGVQENLSSSISSSSEEVLVPPKPNNLTMNTLFFGDVFWGRRIAKWSEASDLKVAYPFSGLNTLEKNKYQAWIADLECPITDGNLTDYQQENLLQFNCRPEYLTEAKKYFDVFSLANNHTDNMQEIDGLNQTRKYLENEKIQYFGHFDNSVKEDLCEIVSLPVINNYSSENQQILEKIKEKESQNQSLNNSSSDSNSTSSEDSSDSSSSDSSSSEIPKLEKKSYIPIAMCGYHNVFKLPLEDELAVIKKYSEKFFTIIMPHQGSEYGTRSDQLQQQYYKMMIDNGADVVIGNHPHTVHETESYNGKLIVYSLGNFIFDQQFSQNVTTGIAANLNFNFQYDQNLENWLEIGEECRAFKDDCLTKSKNLSKLKNFEIDYNIIATDNSNQLAKKASEEIQNLMLKRTNFENVKPNLQTKF